MPPPMKCSIEARCRRVRPGSEDGTRLGLAGVKGVIALGGDLDEPTRVNLCANLRNGEIERDKALLLCARCFGGLSTGGVLRKPFFFRDLDVVPADVLDPASLDAALRSSPVSTRRTCSISASVRAIRSLRVRHRCVDSACLRRHSPFLVTRSCTPLSIIESTFVVAGM